jgi:hypothetical protein
MLAMSAPAAAQSAAPLGSSATLAVSGPTAAATASGVQAAGATGGPSAVGADAASDTASLHSAFDSRQRVLDQRSEENNYRYAVAEHNC